MRELRGPGRCRYRLTSALARPSKPYVVRSSDYLTALAHQRQTTVPAILADPNNAEFKKRRPHPEILLRGDVVFLPDPAPAWFSVNVGATNTFVGKLPNVDVKLTLRQSDGTPIANKTVTTTPTLGTAPLTTDGGGAITLSVPIGLRTVQIAVDGGGPVFNVNVGNLDPHDAPSGLLSRLRQLGHVGDEGPHARARQWLSGVNADLENLSLQRGIESYQASNGHDVTGEADDTLCASVRDDHGC